MSQFAQFVEPEIGDRFAPKDNVGHTVIIKPLEYKTGVVTSQSPTGTDAIGADVYDMDVPDGLYKDTLLFGGAFVDALKPYLGQLVVVKIESRTSKANRAYAVPVPVDEAGTKRAEDVFAKGDPFAAAVTTIKDAPQDGPPF